jgi:hypothetical protein
MLKIYVTSANIIYSCILFYFLILVCYQETAYGHGNIFYYVFSNVTISNNSYLSSLYKSQKILKTLYDI